MLKQIKQWNFCPMLIRIVHNWSSGFFLIYIFFKYSFVNDPKTQQFISLHFFISAILGV